MMRLRWSMKQFLFILYLAVTPSLLGAFIITKQNNYKPRALSSRIMRTYASSNSDGNNSEERGYGPVGSLIRQGPVPFFIRITNPQTYEAAVEKYMALEKCDRNTAQGNMDAYFQDPNGWASNKLRGIEIDYANFNTKPKDLILTAIWASGIIFLGYRIFAVQVLHQ